MANEFKIRKGLIVEGASGGTAVDVQGSQGQLFSVTDNLSGSIFAVSDISGVPIFDVNSNGGSVFTGLVSGITPVVADNFVTKAYVDGTGGGTGPFLPLAAGSGSPLTGDLYLGAFNKISGVAGDNLVIGVDINNSSGASSFNIQMDGTTSAFYINNSRQVGIGTTNIANAQLKVAGGGVDVESSTDSLRLRFYEGATFKSGIQQVLNVGEMISGSAVGDMAIRASAGNMLFAAGGNTENMRITSGGNLLVGNTTGGYAGTKIHVGNFTDSQNGINILTSTTGYGYILFGDGTGADTYRGQITYKHSDDYMAFNTAGTQQMTILSSGNVGIGETNPGQKLHVVGNVFLNANSAYMASYNNTNNYHGSLRWAGLQLGNNGTNRIVAGRTNIGGSLQFWTNNTTDAADYTVTPDGTMTMIMTETGRVGIGTTTPDSKLQVAGQQAINWGITNSSANGLVTIGEASTTVGGSLFVRTPTHSTYYPGGFAVDGAYADIVDRKSTIKLHAYGVYASGWNADMAFYTSAGAGETEKMRITAAGNVGIGTTTPNAKLDIQGTQGQLFSVTDDLSGDIFAVADISGVPLLNVNSNGTSYFDSDLGIGTTTPDGKLEVSSNTSLSSYVTQYTNDADGAELVLRTARGTQSSPVRYNTNDSAGRLLFQAYTSSGAFRDAASIESIMESGYANAYGGLRFNYMPNTAPYTLREGMSIKMNGDVLIPGDVGIGTTNPSYKLDVNNSVNENIARFYRVGSATSISHLVSTGRPQTRYSYDGQQAWYVGNNIGTFGIGTGYLASTEPAFNIKSTGYVGIHTDNPLYLLDVRDGTSSGAIARFSAINAHVIIESSTAGNAVLHFKPNTTGAKNGQFKVTAGNGYGFSWSNDASGTAETAYMDLDTSTTGGGDLTVKGDVIAYGSPSDKKYKENIKPIESALDKAMQLQGVTFDWKDSESILEIKEDIGFIAQDVQEVLPELVRDNGKGNLSLRYQGITPILLEAIKELKAEIEELKKQIK